jgi:hypothetical protein
LSLTTGSISSYYYISSTTSTITPSSINSSYSSSSNTVSVTNVNASKYFYIIYLFELSLSNFIQAKLIKILKKDLDDDDDFKK